MFKHILIPTDGSKLSQNAIDYGIALAKSADAKITVLTVSMPFHVFALDPGMVTDTLEQYQQRVSKLAERHLESAKKSTVAAGVTCATLNVFDEQPYRAIIDTAAGNSCDLIVMASHGRRGVSAVVLGSETVKVLTHSSIPVLVVRLPR